MITVLCMDQTFHIHCFRASWQQLHAATTSCLEETSDLWRKLVVFSEWDGDINDFLLS